MALFPNTPAPSWSVVTVQRWRTIVTPFDGANERRMQKDAYPKFDMVLAYKLLSKSEIQTFWNFYNARRGAYEAFYVYALDTADYKGLFVATADGSTTTFDIPGKSTSEQSIYLNGILQSSGYSILTGGGTENSDRVEFSSAPPEGTVISCDFTGYLRNRCRFEEDSMSWEWFSVACHTTGLQLKGLRFE